MEPLVSVVIPTHQRSHLIGHAVQSALAQSLKEIEVIVVIDGRDEATEHALASIADDRLRVVTLETNQGAGIARNVGAEHARAEWVAFLDDDDKWMPRKLEIQWATAQKSTYRYPLISCRVIVRSQSGEQVLPRRVYTGDEPLSEYLFCRRGIWWGDGMILPTTIFVKRELVALLPFNALRRSQDIHWLLRAGLRADVGIEFVSEREPLAVWNRSNDAARLANPNQQRDLARGWTDENLHLFTPRAYAAYVLLTQSFFRAHTRDPRVFWDGLQRAFRYGKPRARDVLIYCGIWLRLDALGQKVARRKK